MNVAHSVVEHLNREHDLAVGAARTALVHAMNCGKLLAECKAAVGQGGWSAWLAANFDGSQQTAATYMRLHHRRGELPQVESALSIRAAAKMLSTSRRRTSVPDLHELVKLIHRNNVTGQATLLGSYFSDIVDRALWKAGFRDYTDFLGSIGWTEAEAGRCELAYRRAGKALEVPYTDDDLRRQMDHLRHVAGRHDWAADRLAYIEMILSREEAA